MIDELPDNELTPEQQAAVNAAEDQQAEQEMLSEAQAQAPNPENEVPASDPTPEEQAAVNELDPPETDADAEAERALAAMDNFEREAEAEAQSLTQTLAEPLEEESDLPAEYGFDAPAGADDADPRVDALEGITLGHECRVSYLEELEKQRLLGGDDNGILLGKPASPYKTGATISLTPCDASGTTTGAANMTVQAGWTLPTGLTGTELEIPTSAIIPFQQSADGKYYVLGQPVQAWGQVTYSTTTHKLYQRTWFDWGWFRTTISDLQEITTAVDCTA